MCSVLAAKKAKRVRMSDLEPAMSEGETPMLSDRNGDTYDRSLFSVCKKYEDREFEEFTCSKESGRKGLVTSVSHHQMDGANAPVEGAPPNFPASAPH